MGVFGQPDAILLAKQRWAPWRSNKKKFNAFSKRFPPERLPILDRIVGRLASEDGERELIWDADEVAVIRDIVAHKNRERFFDADEADRYLRHLSDHDVRRRASSPAAISRNLRLVPRKPVP